MNLLIYLFIFIIGAIMGSFLGCMGYRIPNKIKTTYPSSFCAYCKKSLKWYMNIPILSYIFLKGKCKYCKKKIGSIYFICEILCASLYTFSYYLYGISFEFFISIILISMFITTIVSDFLYYYISDRVIIISCILIIIMYLIYNSYSSLMNNLISAIIIFLLMIGLKILGNSLFKKESLGDGDIKLMAVVALALGLLGSFVSLFISSITALIYALLTLKKNKEGIIPFGPFILFGSILVLYLSNIIIPYLENLLAL